MIKLQEYQKFLKDYLEILQSLLRKPEAREAKFLASLRIAERSFNFLVDRFPQEKVREIFGLENWQEMKRQRDKLASEIADVIEADPQIKERYGNYCEALKDTKRLSYML